MTLDLAMTSSVWHQRYRQQKKKKTREMRLYENLKILFIQRHCWQTKKATQRMEKNLCKPHT